MKLIIIMILSSSQLLYPFSYDSAISAAQKGNWQDAHTILNTLITHNPDSADVMYDAGVAAYNLGNHSQAATCFTRAAECSVDKDIRFRGYFNAGNAFVDQKELKNALKEYDKALAIEPDNEYARHNRDRVEQMLKDQNKNDQDKQNNDKEKENQQDEQKKDGQQENQDEQNQKGDNQDNQEQNGDDDQSSQNKQNGDQKNDQKNQKPGNDQRDELNEKSQGDQGNDAADKGKNAERKENRNKEQQQKNAADNEQRDGKDDLDKKVNDAQSKGDKQQGNQHVQAPEKQNNNDKSNVPSYGKQEQVIDDPWLLNVLNNQEMQDKAINKQLMEAKIRQHGGKNGQNCW